MIDATIPKPANNIGSNTAPNPPKVSNPCTVRNAVPITIVAMIEPT